MNDIKIKLDVYKAYNTKKITKEQKESCEYMIEATKDNELAFNLSKWKRGSNYNILFITGLSGSGKSTLASKMAKENEAIHVEVDLLEHNDILFHEEKPDKGNQIMKEYMEKNYGGAHKFQTSDMVSFTKEVIKFLTFMLKYAKEHKDDLFIVEGIQIADASTWNPSNTKVDGKNVEQVLNLSMKLMDLIQSYPVIVKNTSILASIYRSARREGLGTYVKTFNSLASVKEYINFYMEMNRNKKQFIKNMKKNA